MNAEAIDDGRTWTLGDMDTGSINLYKYLGILVGKHGTDGTKQNRNLKINQWVGRLESVARCRANRYGVVRGIWKGIPV